MGIERVLRRGSGEILIERDDAILVRDCISGAYMMACDDTSTGVSLLERYIGDGCDLLMVSSYALGMAAFERFGFSGKLECFQVAYYGEKPSSGAELSSRDPGKPSCRLGLSSRDVGKPSCGYGMSSSDAGKPSSSAGVDIRTGEKRSSGAGVSSSDAEKLSCRAGLSIGTGDSNEE